MRYKTRLRAALVIILLFPVLLIIMSYGIFGKFQIKKLEQHYDITLDDSGNWFDTIAVMDEISRKYGGIIEKEIGNGSFEADYREKADELNRIFARTYSYLVIYDGGRFTYIGMPAKMESAVLMDLPVTETAKSLENCALLIDEENKYLVQLHGFQRSEGDNCLLYLISETNRMLPEVENYLNEFWIMSILVIALMIFCLVIWAYKSFLAPMRKLRKAMAEISEGNLDFEVKEDYEDEFGGLCHDFEEMRIHLKRAVYENVQSNARCREIIGNISHDLKTPLTTIKGYVEGIMDGVADTPGKQERYLKTIYNKAVDMEQLVGELSDYTLIDTDDIPYYFRELKVREYFEDCVEDIRTDLESRNFTVTYFNYIDGDVKIMADPEQLHKVINNIINNSVKYNNKEKGIINIRLKEENEYIHAEFEDNGKGVPPGEAEKIFERFYRTDTSRNSKTGGSGIGLSIVKKITETHGGCVWAVSNENVGMTIHLMLPKKASGEEKQAKKGETDEKEKNSDHRG